MLLFCHSYFVTEMLRYQHAECLLLALLYLSSWPTFALRRVCVCVCTYTYVTHACMHTSILGQHSQRDAPVMCVCVNIRHSCMHVYLRGRRQHSQRDFPATCVCVFVHIHVSPMHACVYTSGVSGNILCGKLRRCVSASLLRVCGLLSLRR